MQKTNEWKKPNDLNATQKQAKIKRHQTWGKSKIETGLTDTPKVHIPGKKTFLCGRNQLFNFVFIIYPHTSFDLVTLQHITTRHITSHASLRYMAAQHSSSLHIVWHSNHVTSNAGSSLRRLASQARSCSPSCLHWAETSVLQVLHSGDVQRGIEGQDMPLFPSSAYLRNKNQSCQEYFVGVMPSH